MLLKFNRKHLLIKITSLCLLVIGASLVLSSHVYANGSPPADPNTANVYYSNCPAPGQPNQTLHGVYPNPGTVSAPPGSRTAGTSLFAQSYLCGGAGYNFVGNIHIIVTGVISNGTPASFDMGPLPHDFGVGDINGQGNWSAAVGQGVTMNGLVDGWNCWTVQFYAVATYGSTRQTSGTGSWPVCVYFTFTAATTTVQGHMFEVDSAGNFLGNVANQLVDTCNGYSLATQNDGFFTWSNVNQGTGFCLRPQGSAPSGFDGPYLRPWSEGYAGQSCPGYGGPPYTGHCGPVGAGYECQIAGGLYPTCGGNIDRNWDAGYDFVYVRKPVNVQGHVFKVDSNGNYLGDVPSQLYVCDNNRSVSTAANGFFNFSIDWGNFFCARPTSAGPGGYVTGPFIRPWSEGYSSPSSGPCQNNANPPAGFGPVGSPPRYPGHCNDRNYEWQVAGKGQGYVGRPQGTFYDRVNDGGYDFVYVVPPANSVQCGNINVNPSPPEVGQQFTAKFNFTNPAVPNTLNYSVKLSFSTSGMTIYPPNPQSGSEAANNTTSPPLTFTLSAANPGEYSGAFDVSGDINLHCPFGPGFPQNPVQVSTKPYYRVYGGDVTAGGGISPACPSANGDIIAWNKNNAGFPPSYNSYGGAGTQLAAFALGHLFSFVSGSTGYAASSSPTTLSFANNSPGNVSIPGAKFGGGFTGVRCIPDYYAAHHSYNDNGGSVNFNLPGTRSWDVGGGGVLVTSNIQPGAKIAFYVNGNITIQGDMNYVGSSGWGSTDQIPSLYIIATGNIYIGKNVRHLDGVYISTHGTIYTCAKEDGSGLYPTTPDQSQLVSNCQNSLVVDGSFIAPQIKLLRLRTSATGSLGQAQPGDGPDTNKQAEIFQFTPELWLTLPGNDPHVSGTPPTSDSITNLPPIL